MSETTPFQKTIIELCNRQFDESQCPDINCPEINCPENNWQIAVIGVSMVGFVCFIVGGFAGMWYEKREKSVDAMRRRIEELEKKP